MTLLDTRRELGGDPHVAAGGADRPAEQAPAVALDGRPRRLPAAVTTVAVVVLFLAALAAVGGAAALLAFPHTRVTQLAVHPAWLVPAVAVAALVVLVAAWHAARRLVRGKRPAAILTFAAAADASVSAATGMWVFFGSVLHMSVLTRIPIFSFLEIATIAFAFKARDNLLESGARAARAPEGEKVTPSRGLDGILMWLCTATSACLSSMASVSPAEAAFRLATPLIAGLLWESSMSAEYHRQAGKQKKAIHWRFTVERVMVWAGFADPAARDIPAVAADRCITQAAVAVVRARRAKAAGWRAWTMHRARVRVRLAEQRAGLAGDEDHRTLLLHKIAILDTTARLVSMQINDPWRQPAPADRKQKDARTPPPPPPPRGGPESPELMQLAKDLSGVIPAAFEGDEQAARQVHALLAGRDDYPALCRLIARHELRAPKRMMAAIALYALGNTSARATAREWISSQVGGQAGQVDRNEIRLIAQQLEPVWDAERYPGQPAAATTTPAGGGA